MTWPTLQVQTQLGQVQGMIQPLKVGTDSQRPDWNSAPRNTISSARNTTSSALSGTTLIMRCMTGIPKTSDWKTPFSAPGGVLEHEGAGVGVEGGDRELHPQLGVELVVERPLRGDVRVAQLARHRRLCDVYRFFLNFKYICIYIFRNKKCAWKCALQFATTFFCWDRMTTCRNHGRPAKQPTKAGNITEP